MESTCPTETGSKVVRRGAKLSYSISSATGDTRKLI